MAVTIRAEQASDREAVYAVNSAAFGIESEYEAPDQKSETPKNVETAIVAVLRFERN